MKLFQKRISVSCRSGVDIVNITSEVNKLVRTSSILTGIIQLNCISSTVSMTAMEYETAAVNDTIKAIEFLIAPNSAYEHNEEWSEWEKSHGHSHVQAALVGPSIGFSITNGKVVLDKSQQIVLINHYIQPQHQEVAVTIIGE